MMIRFLGVGGAFSPELGSSAAVVDTGLGTYTLIDAGCSTYGDLCRTHWIDRITHIIVTHLHDDHVGSLGSIINHRYHVDKSPVTLVFPPWLREPLLTLLRLQRTSDPIENFLKLQQLNGEANQVGSTHIQPVNTTGLHQENMPSSAYVFQGPDSTVAYSGDLADPDVVFDALSDSDKPSTVVFHDVSFADNIRGSHVYYKELDKHLDAGWDIRGYHNSPVSKPDDCRLKLVSEDPETAPQ
ncbi:MAG: MBL fold metallo-hydrolase [Candidatus Sumerlaeaceae bacterium]